MIILIDDRFYTDRSIIDWVIGLYNETGFWPSVYDMRNADDAPPRSLVDSRFAGFAALLRAAKLVGGFLTEDELKKIQPRQDWILARLKQKCENSSQRVSRLSIERDPKMPHTRDFAIYCGGIDHALRMIDQPLTMPSCDDLLEMIRKTAKRLGRTPAQIDALNGLCGYSRDIYLKRYPYWNALLIAAGLPPVVDRPEQRAIRARQREERQRLKQQILAVQSA